MQVNAPSLSVFSNLILKINIRILILFICNPRAFENAPNQVVSELMNQTGASLDALGNEESIIDKKDRTSPTVQVSPVDILAAIILALPNSFWEQCLPSGHYLCPEIRRILDDASLPFPLQDEVTALRVKLETMVQVVPSD